LKFQGFQGFFRTKIKIVLCAGAPAVFYQPGAAVFSSQLQLENQNDLYYVCDLIAGKYVIQ
jgi:hypothetical protein